MALKTLKNGSKAFNFATKSNDEVLLMLATGLQMVREAPKNRKESRMRMVSEIAQELNRRGLGAQMEAVLMAR